MSDEKQLTVAELLARAGKESDADEEKKPRRRRRSLEEGGVSVAELTGSIPKVKAKPSESRHSSVPIDAEDKQDSGEQPASDEKHRATGQEAVAKDQSPVEGAAQSSGADATDTAASVTDRAADQKGAKTTGKAAAKPAAQKPAAITPEQAQTPAGRKPGTRSTTSDAAATGAPSQGKPAAKADRETVEKKTAEKKTAEPKSGSRDTGKPTATGKPGDTRGGATKPAGKPKPAEEQPGEKAVDRASRSGATPASKLNRQPNGKKDSAPADAKQQPAEGDAAQPDAGQAAGAANQPSPSRDETAVIEAVDIREPQRREATVETPEGMSGTVTAAAAVPAGIATGSAAVPDTPRSAADTETTGEMSVVRADDAAGNTTGATAAGALGETADEDEEEGISIWAMLGLAVLGIILGAIVFLLFDQLWMRLPNIVVAIAAVVVTAVMVVGTKLLRTVNDGLSMTLAGIVGLLMTFGPALILVL